MVALTFSYSQSDVAFAKRMMQSNGFLRLTPTAPAWMRRSVPLGAGESLAVWFDTPTEFFVGTDVSAETLKRAAEIESLRWVVFDNREITERHVVAFEGHPTIKGIRLANTDVTDDIFPVLESLPELAFVSLSMTNVTPEGLEAFRERHPNIEIEVDPLTASGLLKIANGRARFDSEGGAAGTLMLRGPIDDELLSAAKRLPVRRLVLEGIDAGKHLTGLVEAQRIEYLHIRGGTLDVSFAKAVSVSGLSILELSEISLTTSVATALANSRPTSINLEAVVWEPHALATLLDGTRLDYLRLQGLSLSDDDVFQSVSVQDLVLDRVGFRMISQPFTNASIEYLRLNEIEADGTIFAELAGLPSRGLAVAAPAIRDPAQGAWLTACRASYVSLARLTLNSADAKALAAAPINHLLMSEINWREGSPAAFENARVQNIDCDRLPSELAQPLTGSAIEELIIRERVPGPFAAVLGRLKNLKQLVVHVESPTPEQIAALVDAPALEQVNLTLISPPTLPPEFWRQLAESRPDLRLSVYVEVPLPDGRMSKRLWPE